LPFATLSNKPWCTLAVTVESLGAVMKAKKPVKRLDKVARKKMNWHAFSLAGTPLFVD
jgi:hypothetical protein